MPEIGIGLLGVGWMGQLHSASYRRVRDHYPACQANPRLVIAADASEDRARAATDGARLRELDGGLARGARASGGGRGQHHRPELPALRDGPGRRRGRQAHLDREADRAIPGRDDPRRRRCHRGRSAKRGRARPPPRARRPVRAPAHRLRAGRRGQPLPLPLPGQLRQPPARGSPGASRAIWPATGSSTTSCPTRWTWPSSCSVRSPG